jgi:SAM-dependent methyltransferase
MINYGRLEKIALPCPLCGGTRFQNLADNDRYGMGVQTSGCMSCGLVQTWPRPTSEAMSTFYSEYYRKYYQEAATPDAAYINRYRKDERLKYTAQLIAAHVPFFPGMRVLDIGCAEGTLIANLKTQCNETVFVGVEPSESFSLYARQKTECSTYPDLDALIKAGEASFDLIIVNHVLEHVDNPVSLLGRLHQLLVSGGKIYVDVPDVASYARPEDLHIAHLFHFSERTLPAAFEKAGFWVLTTVCHTPPHHPSSIWSMAEKRGTASHVAKIGARYETDAWDCVRNAAKGIPFYLLKARVRRYWLISYVWEKLKVLRGAHDPNA